MALHFLCEFGFDDTIAAYKDFPCFEPYSALVFNNLFSHKLLV